MREWIPISRAFEDRAYDIQQRPLSRGHPNRHLCGIERDETPEHVANVLLYVQLWFALPEDDAELQSEGGHHSPSP